MGAYRGLLFALIGGIASAILSIGTFGPAPVLAIGLSLGSAFAGIAAGSAALLILVNFNSASTIFYIVATGLPALLIIRQALIQQPGATPSTVIWYPPGKILGWLSAYGLLVLGCISLYFAFSNDQLETVSRKFLGDFFTQLLSQSEASFRSDTERALVKNIFDLAADRLAPLLVGFLLSFYTLTVIANATITQGILNRAGLSNRPSPSYSAMTLPRWLSGALAGSVLIALLPGSISIVGQNGALILSIPFLLLGLTVIHTLSQRTPNPRVVLVAFYFALFLSVALVNISLPVLALLVLLGMVEQWTSLRRRFKAPGTNQEDE